jgi:hypothetical protein
VKHASQPLPRRRGPLEGEVRALQVRIAFHRGDSKGIYFGSVLVTARGCGLDDLLVGGGGLDSFYSKP